MNIQKIAFNFLVEQGTKTTKSLLCSRPEKITNFNGLKYTPLKEDVLKLSEKAEFIRELYRIYSSSDVKINGEIFTKFKYSAMGSNPAFWAINPKTGELSYIKYAKTTEKQGHIESEVTASKLYNLAGIQTPKIELCKIDENLTGLKSQYCTGLKDFSAPKQVQECFTADAWLANWDSLIDENTMLQNGKAIKIDCGGALNYRAMGKLKQNFKNKVEELVTLTDGRNWASKSIYAKMTHKDLLKSFKKVTTITDESIRQTVRDKELAQTLINRKNYLLQIQQIMEQTPYTGNNLAKYFEDIDKTL